MAFRRIHFVASLPRALAPDLGDRDPHLLGFMSTQAYDYLQIEFSADVLDDVAHAFDACTSAQPP